MLFNSYIFILVFLPITLAGFLALAKWRPGKGPVAWLLATSLFFYGWWNPPYLLLVVISIVFNYGIAWWILRAKPGRGKAAPLVFGLAGNLGLLGYFKYADFFLDNIAALTGSGAHLGNIILPIGISFYTIQQLAYLIDCYRSRVSHYSFLRYGLFVVFFPQLIAGPIVRAQETIPQFGGKVFENLGRYLSIGLTVFFIGLFKKVVLADSMGPLASSVFDHALAHGEPGFIDAWAGALAYTLQIYFDFSGYSDMAIGLAYMFGIRLPLNFQSPYRSLSIVDFWRRWHMTLSNFLRNYLYISLGGSRRGLPLRYINLLATMLIGGLRHGASWTFVIWGALHGMYLVINHGWRSLFRSKGESALSAMMSWTVTFVAVVAAWTFFRAESLGSALAVLRGMAGFNGIELPQAIRSLVPPLASAPSQTAVDLVGASGLILIVIFLVIALRVPDTHQLLGKAMPTIEPPAKPARWHWRPNLRWAVAVGAMAAISLFMMLSRVSEFLYFQF